MGTNPAVAARMDTPMTNISLIGLMLDAPLLGVLRRWPDRLHAVDMQAIAEGWDRGTFHAACGARSLRLVGARWNDERVAALWPPRIRSLPPHRVRCRTCWEATGRMRPRVDWSPDVK